MPNSCGFPCRSAASASWRCKSASRPASCALSAASLCIALTCSAANRDSRSSSRSPSSSSARRESICDNLVCSLSTAVCPVRPPFHSPSVPNTTNFCAGPTSKDVRSGVETIPPLLAAAQPSARVVRRLPTIPFLAAPPTFCTRAFSFGSAVVWALPTATALPVPTAASALTHANAAELPTFATYARAGEQCVSRSRPSTQQPSVQPCRSLCSSTSASHSANAARMASLTLADSRTPLRRAASRDGSSAATSPAHCMPFTPSRSA
mmetsp:Transcript_17185/g.38530  ORF Transcript_17185/g.38530 Transcript_17185/m.38530 type:complete len:265 (+) Transcript_17185:934-1728(+)